MSTSASCSVLARGSVSPHCKCSFVLVLVLGMESRTLHWLDRLASKLQPHALHYKRMDSHYRKLGSRRSDTYLSSWHKHTAHTNNYKTPGRDHLGTLPKIHLWPPCSCAHMHLQSLCRLTLSQLCYPLGVFWSCSRVFSGCSGALCRGASGMAVTSFVTGVCSIC